MASLKTTDVLTDKYVETIIATLSATDGMRQVTQSDIDENPIFTLLAETGALDSNVAAVLVAEEMLGGRGDLPVLAKLLPPAIGEVVTLLHGDNQSPFNGLAAMMDSGNALAAKLAVSALTLAGDESQLAQARGFSDPAQLAEMAREMSDVAAEIIEGGIAHGSLRGLTTELAEKFVESVGTLTDMAGGQTRLKLMNQTLDKFRAEMAQGGVYLAPAGVAATATPAAEPGVVASLAFDDILADPIVVKTLKALGADVSTVDPSEINNLDTAPIINLLIETNCLDSVSAAVLLVDDATRGRSLRNLPKPVADALSVLHDEQVVYSGPAALLATDNVHVHKVTFAAITSAITGDEFKQALPEMDASSRKRMVSEMADVGVQLIERVTETNSWKEMSPELVDRFTKGLSDLANLTEGRASKRLIQTAIQMLKEDIAGETAKDITTPPKAGLQDNLPPAPKLKRGPGGFNA
ncbi:MAG: hypothetical protein IT560_02600 [Alphaproteobacteria bacterium]|nr:hypothetical protein [Alphaproteobacteria bacterium]